MNPATASRSALPFALIAGSTALGIAGTDLVLPARRCRTALDGGRPSRHLRPMPQTTITIRTTGQGLHEITEATAAFVEEAGVETGLLTAFVRHTSASLVIQENADPDVRRDLEAFFARLVPPADDPSMGYLVHRLEGPDDMPAHIRAALTQTSLSIPIGGGALLLGTWQGLYLFEHRTRPHRRDVVLHIGA